MRVSPSNGVAPRSDLAADDDLVGRVVDELMPRLPASTDRALLERAGRRAAVDARLSGGASAIAADVETAVRAALVRALRAQHPSVPERTAPDPVECERLVGLVAALPPLQRRVVEGYFVAVREVTELARDLDLSIPELVAVRRDALIHLRDAYRPAS